MNKKLVKALSAAALSAALYISPLPAQAAGNEVPALKQAAPTEVKSIIEELAQPYGIAPMANGSILVVSSQEGRIMQWSSGQLSTLAGPDDRKAATKNDQDIPLATGGYNDGPARSAVFNHPTYTAVDSKGTVYISDTDNNVVRKVKAGRVYTLAGSGSAGYKDGKAGAAEFNAPAGLAVDKEDNLYVADTLNQVIRKITPDGNVTTFAGQASDTGAYADGEAVKSRFNEPTGLAYDGQGGLYVSDSGNQLIRLIQAGKVTTFAGTTGSIDPQTGYVPGRYADGSKAQAGFNRPRGLAYSVGTLFVADTLNHRIRAIGTDGQVVTLAGQGSPGGSAGSNSLAGFNEPSGVAYTSGTLYITDTLNNSVKALKVDPLHLQPVRSDEDLLAEVDLLPRSNDIQVWMNGRVVKMTDGKKAFRKDEHVYVPIRNLFSSWGAEVKWLPATKEVSISSGNWIRRFGIIGTDVISMNGTIYADIAYLRTAVNMQAVYDYDSNAVVMRIWK